MLRFRVSFFFNHYGLKLPVCKSPLIRQHFSNYPPTTLVRCRRWNKCIFERYWLWRCLSTFMDKQINKYYGLHILIYFLFKTASKIVQNNNFRISNHRRIYFKLDLFSGSVHFWRTSLLCKFFTFSFISCHLCFVNDFFVHPFFTY